MDWRRERGKKGEEDERKITRLQKVVR